MLLVRRDNTRPGNPATHIVMQHRADNRYWAIPGGARDVGETYRQTAIRETSEETSLPLNCAEGPNPLVVVRREAALTDHGAWKYVTLIADVVGQFVPRRRPFDVESLSVEWVPIDQVGVGRITPLLPAFGEAWPTLLEMVREMDLPIPAPKDDPKLAETGQPVPPPQVSVGLTAATSGGEALVPNPFTRASDDEEDLRMEREWLAAQENLCLWFIPAMP